MQVVITGGAGFIGANLSRYLVEHSDTVTIRVLDDLSTGSRANVPKSHRIELIEGSILDAQLTQQVVQSADAVVHLAARPSVPRSIADPRTTHDVNVTGTVNVLEAARANGSPHVIVASSSSVYGANEVLPKTESLAPQPMSPYAASKLATESYALAWSHSYRIPALALRFFNVYGPLQRADHDYAAAIPRFIQALLDDRPIQIYGTGKQTRDFTYVDSLCSLIHDALIRRVTCPTPVNAAFGSRTSLLEIVKSLGILVGRRPNVEFLSARVGDVLHSQADSAHLTELFSGIRPTGLNEGLRRTYDWLKNQAG